MSRILVTGTLAIDYTGRYAGRFQDLPRHGGINLSVELDRIDRRFGGCAMNIAYGLALLGDDPVPFVFVGDDHDADYAEHLEGLGIDRSGIVRVPGAVYSSHAFVFTDRDGNQFTGFYPGPARLPDFPERLADFARARDFDYAVVAPDIAPNMIAAARVLNALEVPFLCDPGQCLTDFAAAEARALVALSRELIVNRFEYDTLKAYCGADPAADLDCLVVTTGPEGSSCGEVSVPAAPAARVVDPTGCGDAYRTGFVHARLRRAPLVEAMRAGACAAAIKIETDGTQRHRFDDFPERYAAAWGHAPEWLGEAGSQRS